MLLSMSEVNLQNLHLSPMGRKIKGQMEQKERRSQSQTLINTVTTAPGMGIQRQTVGPKVEEKRDKALDRRSQKGNRSLLNRPSSLITRVKMKSSLLLSVHRTSQPLQQRSMFLKGN